MHNMPIFLLTVCRKCPIPINISKRNMHNMPIELLAAFIGSLGALQGLSLLLTNLEIAAKRIEGRSTWVAADGTKFEEFAVSEIEGSQVMLQDFEESRGRKPFSPCPSTANPPRPSFLRSSSCPAARNLPRQSLGSVREPVLELLRKLRFRPTPSLRANPPLAHAVHSVNSVNSVKIQQPSCLPPAVASSTSVRNLPLRILG